MVSLTMTLAVMLLIREHLRALDETFGFSEEQDLFLKAYLEHPFPLLPNVKLGYTTLSHDGSSNVDGFTWGDIDNFTWDY